MFFAASACDFSRLPPLRFPWPAPDAHASNKHLNKSYQGTIVCTPNSVAMVLMGCSLGILGDETPINTHYIGLI